jgi:hypothetical protein
VDSPAAFLIGGDPTVVAVVMDAPAALRQREDGEEQPNLSELGAGQWLTRMGCRR